MRVRDIVGGEIWDTDTIVWTVPGETFRDNGLASTVAHELNVGAGYDRNYHEPWGYDNEQDVFWPVEVLDF